MPVGCSTVQRMKQRFLAIVALVALQRTSRADCASDAKDLASYLRSLGETRETVMVPAETKLVARGDLTDGASALQVGLTSNKTWVDQRQIEIDKIGEELALQAKMHADPDWQRTRPGMAGHYQDVVIIVDESRPWSDVVAVVQAAAKAGFGHARFVFALAKQPSPPPHTAIDDVVAAAKPGQRQVVLAPAMKGFVASCPALDQAFLPPRGTDRYLQKLVPRVEQALATCQCKVDLAQLRSALFYELTPEEKTGVIEVDLGKRGQAIKLPGKTPWIDAQKQIKAGTLSLAVR
ncbi:MAG: hypothetical protein H6Q90_2662 [Deltaproteobacteria bacterium]|nr:hypothetical protein [Deltaproteobacteria bacterium]